MVSRISDLRVEQARRHGRIVGLPTDFAEEVAALSDFLVDCHAWSDVSLPFDGAVDPHGTDRWRVPVDNDWWLTFRWDPPFGPVDLELWHDDDRRDP